MLLHSALYSFSLGRNMLQKQKRSVEATSVSRKRVVAGLGAEGHHASRGRDSGAIKKPRGMPVDGLLENADRKRGFLSQCGAGARRCSSATDFGGLPATTPHP